MADRSTIEWTDATWNPVTGCTKVSAGCDHCYAETFAERWRGIAGHHFEHGFDLTLRPERLAQPLTWQRPRRIFVNSMSDLFHHDVPDAFIAAVFAAMIAAPQHTFQLLTKRHARMRTLLTRHDFALTAYQLAISIYHTPVRAGWPLPNVWLGVSAETQPWANLRIPALLATPAAVRFVSAEPLLGPINLTQATTGSGRDHGIDWLIVGGESGPHARPMHPDWARSLRDQAAAVGVPFFFKQHGAYTWQIGGPYRTPDLFVSAEDGSAVAEHEVPDHGSWAGVWKVGKRRAGRSLDGQIWSQIPALPTPVRPTRGHTR